MMKKALGLFLSLVIVVTMIPAMVLPAAAATPDWEDVVLLSEGATISESDCYWSYHSVTFKVTLPANGGYAQLDRKLTALTDDDVLDVKVTVGDGTVEDYEKTNFNVQLTTDSTAATDCVPIQEHNESGWVTPPTDALTWGFKYYSDNDTIYLSRGVPHTTGGTALQTPSYMVTSDQNGQIGIQFSKNDNNTVKGRWFGGPPSISSQLTLSEIDGDGTDGVYVRIRNYASEAITYTVTAPVSPESYTDGSYIFSDEGSELISSAETTKADRITRTATFRLSANGGYVQLSQKLLDLSDTEGNVDVQLIIGDGTSEDYKKTNLNIQLTADSTGATDLTPIAEYGKSAAQIPTNALSYGFLYYAGTDHIYLSNGLAHTTGAYDVVVYTHSIFTTYGLQLRLTRNENGTVKGRWLNGIPNCSSVHTLSEIGGEDGAFLRIRNNGKEALTYTMTVRSSVPMVKCDANSSLISSSVSYSGKYTLQTATVQLKANGGYAQFSRGITDLAQGDGCEVSVIVGDGSVEDFRKTEFNIQLTADGTAATDCVPVRAYNGGWTPKESIPTDAIS